MSLAILEIFAMLQVICIPKIMLQDTIEPVSCYTVPVSFWSMKQLEHMQYHFLVQLLGGWEFLGVSTKLKPSGRKMH